MRDYQSQPVIGTKYMLKSRGVCHKCGRETYIVNKKYGLCGYCNRERLGIIIIHTRTVESHPYKTKTS